jgi:hypothetical protein
MRPAAAVGHARALIDRVYEQAQNGSMDGLRYFGAAGGAISAILTLIAFAIAPGPSSANGVTVLEYYAAHGTATMWQAGLVGIAIVCFIWFAEVFARELSVGPLAVVGAAVTGALYLVTIGCWEVIAEIYGGVDVGTVTSEDYSDAHVFWDVGTGAAHMAHFTAAAFVGSTAAAMAYASTRRRWLVWIGFALTVVLLISAAIVLQSESHWSDDLGTVVFVAWLAWIFATSVWLIVAIRRRVFVRLGTAA